MLASILAVVLFSSPQIQDDLPALGTNLAAVADGTTEWPFVDVFKVSRPWLSQKAGDPLDFDENGNVKSLKPGQVAETVIFSNGKCPKGKYTLTWEGDGDFEADNGSTLQTVDSHKAVIDLEGDTGLSLMLKRVDPKDPPHNISLVMPGYEETYKDEPFHPVFLQRMSLYRSLRFMDWGRVNGSPVQKWADRALLGLATYASEKGVPYEVMAELANAKVSIPWICVPHQADDDYVRNLARLFKDKLKPGLRVAVEYSNECWNSSLPQSKYCSDQGLRLKLADDARTAGLRYYSQRSQEVFAIFKEVFGGATRLVRILSANAADFKTGQEVISWKNAYADADALAIAPYFGAAVGSPESVEKTKAGSLDDLFATLKSEVEGPLRNSLFTYAALAQKNRIRLVAFAGGQHLLATGTDQADTALNALFDAANRDSRMATLYTAHLKSWREAGGSLYVHYTDCAPYSQSGRWGTLEQQDQDPQTSHKNRALIQYALFPDR